MLIDISSINKAFKIIIIIIITIIIIIIIIITIIIIIIIINCIIRPIAAITKGLL